VSRAPRALPIVSDARFAFWLEAAIYCS